MTLVSERIGQFFSDDHRLEYTEYGAGERWVVLLPGHLMPRRMHQPIARKLAAAGAHVVALDLLGHGRSDRPEDPLHHSAADAAGQVLALLDHLGARTAVIGGSMLGANVALETALLAPDRVDGLLLEAPILENGVQAGLLAGGPLMLAARYAPFAVSAVRVLSRAVPRGVVPFWVGIGLDVLDQRPGSLAASMHGRFFGRVAPSSVQRRTIEVPTLVVGHPHDPLHPDADARMLAEELTDSEFVAARGPLEWRLRPGRLDDLALRFVAGCWDRPGNGRLQASS